MGVDDRIKIDGLSCRINLGMAWVKLFSKYLN
jgi:hypothetical protein